MTSNCDVTNSAHELEMTTTCHGMTPPHENFLLTPLHKDLRIFNNWVFSNFVRIAYFSVCRVDLRIIEIMLISENKTPGLAVKPEESVFHALLS